MTEILNNRYRLLEKRGAGGTAEVHEAVDLRLHRKVAIKRVRGDTHGDRRKRAERLLREAEHLARAEHPNVVAIHDVLEGEDSVSLVLELVEGVPFQELCRKQPIEEREFLGYFRQMLAAIERVHEVGILHRDVNPRNVLVRPDGIIKLTDFGLSSAVDDPEPRAGGTIGYMAPESLRRKGRLGFGVDIWGLGVLSYQALLGTPEFRKLYGAAEPVAWARWVLSRDRFRPIEEVSGKISPWLSGLLARMLEKDVARRYQRIGDLRRDLDRATARPAGEPAKGPSLASAVRRLLPSILARPQEERE